MDIIYIYNKMAIKEILLKMLIDFKHNFKSNFFIEGGTLLGAVRHHSFIPWDDDIDIGIMKDSVEEFESTMKKLESEGYGYCPIWWGYKIYKKDGDRVKRNKWRDHKQQYQGQGLSRVEQIKKASSTYRPDDMYDYEEYRFPFIDVFVWEYLGKNRIGYSGYKNHKLWWPKSDIPYLREDNIFPLQKIKFCGVEFNCFNNPHNYLSFNYGEHYMWLVRVHKKNDHRGYKKHLVRAKVYKNGEYIGESAKEYNAFYMDKINE